MAARIRPQTIFDQGVFDEILERHAEGATVRSVLLTGCLWEENEGKPMPSRTTFYRWLEEQQELAGRFAHARTVAEDTLGDEVIDIARTQEPGRKDKLMFKELTDEEGNKTNELEVVERTEEDALGHRKFKAWAILQILARWNPAKWGNRMNVDHGLQDPLAESLKAARERAATLRDE